MSPNPRLARRRRLTAFTAISAIAALLACLLSLYEVDLLPPRLEKRQVQEGTAVLHAGLRLPGSDRLVTQAKFESNAESLDLIGNILGSQLILGRVGQRMGIDPGRIAANNEVALSTPVVFSEPDNEREAHQILSSTYPYRLDIQARPGLPVLDLYTQAPSAAAAAGLAETALAETNAYLRGLAGRDTPGAQPPTLAQLGTTTSGTLDATASLKIAALCALTALGVSFGLLFLFGQALRGMRRAGNRPPPADDPPPAARSRTDDWPHTTRVLPWMIAGFMTLIWLVPINAITLQASLPVDLKLDRLVLPVIALTWLLARTAGWPGQPRWRFTLVHAGIATFVAVAFVSVALNAVHLSHSLELELAIKKLTLLSAFFALFLLVASSVRASEVGAFMTLTLVLASICAAGVLWEYQSGSNLFYMLAGKLLPSAFQVTAIGTTQFDEIGRPGILGPTDLSLEVVAILAMALPIALVRFMRSSDNRHRLLYGLATCLLVGATLATYRKSALLAPLAVCITLAYFQRRELLRLAPLALAIVIAVPFLAPNALGSIVEQFNPSRPEATTVSDRVSDYDAIRPDVLSHPAFGRGFGSYERTSARILDNDLLVRLVETGLVGLLAYVSMIVLAMVAAAPIIRGRDPTLSASALAIAAAAAAFLVLSALFDIMAFPHAPYILMTFMGFLAAILAARKEPAPAPIAPIAAGAERAEAAETRSAPVPA